MESESVGLACPLLTDEFAGSQALQGLAAASAGVGSDAVVEVVSEVSEPSVFVAAEAVDGLDQGDQEGRGGHPIGLLDEPSKGGLRGPVDGREQVQLAFGCAQLCDVDEEVADRVALERVLGWRVALHIREPRDAMPLQAAVQGLGRHCGQARSGRPVPHRRTRVTTPLASQPWAREEPCFLRPATKP